LANADIVPERWCAALTLAGDVVSALAQRGAKADLRSCIDKKKGGVVK
jgi:hypothetical protein